MKKTARPEHKIQSALMDYLVLAGRRDLHWFAIPNGEHRHIRAAMRLKAEGVRRGVPDLCFMLPQGRVAWLEMKAPNGRLSPDQKVFRDLAKSLDHLWDTASSVDDAIVILSKWGVLKSAYRRDTNFFTTDHLKQIQLKPKEQTSGTQA